jgi:hypothetical protein
LDGLAQFPSLIAEDQQLQRSHNGERSRQFYERPIAIRLLCSLLAVCLGFLGSLWGWQYFDNGRKLLGATLIGGGSLLGIGGFLFWGFWR